MGDPGAGSESGVGGGFEGLVELVGVATGMVDILRLTGVGSADGRRALACSALQPPTGGVKGPAVGF